MTDDKNNLSGIIDYETLRPLIFNAFRLKFTTISEIIANPKALILLEEGMESAMDKFESTKADILPVVQNGKFFGFISKISILESYRERLKEMVID